MADQVLAQTRPLNPPAARISPLHLRTIGRAKRTWSLGRRWLRFIFAGNKWDASQLADFVIREHFFRAMQVPSELTALGEILASRRPERALEIGTAHGGTLLFLTRLASSWATIVSVDLPGGRFGAGYSQRRRWLYQRFSRRGQRLHLFQEDSHSAETLSRVKEAFGGQPLDYLFIDGDHTYEGVKSDFEMYRPLVRKGGLIAFDDIADGPPEYVGGVPRFWNDVRSRYRYTELVNDPHQGGCGIGVLYVD